MKRFWAIALLIGLILTATCRAEELTRESTGEAVIQLQRQLGALGYLSGDPDGGYGENTVRAVWVFQYYNGLPATGSADARTRDALASQAAKPAKYPCLAYPDKSESVRALQSRLTILGFYTQDADGQFGRSTYQAVKAAQEYLQTTARVTDADKARVAPAINGVADPLFQEALFAKSFPVVPAPMREGDEGAEVYRLQRRLIDLDYLSDAPDGGYGANTKSAVAHFQKRCGLKATGAADETTLARLFAADAPIPELPYQLRVDLAAQKLYIYQLDDAGEYTVCRHTIACSTGTRAVPGTYDERTGPRGEWLEAGRVWVRYAFRVADKLYIHSLPYDSKDGTPDRAYLKSLGKKIALEGIVVTEENARLIWEKCPKRTSVIIQ